MISAVVASLSFNGVQPLQGRLAPMQPSAAGVSMSAQDWAQRASAAGLAAALAVASVSPAEAGPFTRSDIASLTYEQIKGTGLANTCPKVEKGAATSIKLGGGKTYKIDEFCLEPTSFQVQVRTGPASTLRRGGRDACTSAPHLLRTGWRTVSAKASRGFAFARVQVLEEKLTKSGLVTEAVDTKACP